MILAFLLDSINDCNMNWLTLLLSTNSLMTQWVSSLCLSDDGWWTTVYEWCILILETVNTAPQLVLQYVFKPSRTQEYVHTKVVYPAKENKDLQGELMLSQLHSIDQTVDAISLTASAAAWLATFSVTALLATKTLNVTLAVLYSTIPLSMLIGLAI